jgi:hypothetical protein
MEEDNKTPAPEKKKNFLFFTLYSAIGTMLGASGAFLYYFLIGCATGTCAITSNPWLSTLWGAVMGFLVGDIISPRKIKEKQE